MPRGRLARRQQEMDQGGRRAHPAVREGHRDRRGPCLPVPAALGMRLEVERLGQRGSRQVLHVEPAGHRDRAVRSVDRVVDVALVAPALPLVEAARAGIAGDDREAGSAVPGASYGLLGRAQQQPGQPRCRGRPRRRRALPTSSPVTVAAKPTTAPSRSATMLRAPGATARSGNDSSVRSGLERCRARGRRGRRARPRARSRPIAGTSSRVAARSTTSATQVDLRVRSTPGQPRVAGAAVEERLGRLRGRAGAARRPWRPRRKPRSSSSSEPVSTTP